MASTTTSYPPNQHDPTFQPINSFHGDPHREFPPRARVDSWHEGAPPPGIRAIANGPTPSDPHAPVQVHARPPSHPSSRRPSFAVDTNASNEALLDKQQPQAGQPFPGSEKQTSPHAASAPGPHLMQHRPTTVPPVATVSRDSNVQHLPPTQTAPPSPSALQYPHHPIQPSQPQAPPSQSHQAGNYPPLQAYPPGPGQPSQMIAPVPHPPPPAAPPQNFHHHSAPSHMGYNQQPPNIRRVSVGPGLPITDADEMSPMTTSFPYHMSSGTTFPPRRKAVRAAQACDACRTRKAKCDEGRPACTFCKDNNTPCVYREVPPPKQDRTMIDIRERVQNIEGLIQKQQSDATLINMIKEIYEAVVAEKQSGEEGLSKGSAMASPEEGSQQERQAQSQVPSDASRSKQTPQKTHAIPVPLSQLPTPTHATTTFPVSSIPHPADDPKEDDNYITIPHKHNTAAHKLLRWKSIKDLLDKPYPENYVMNEETKRGSLNVRGRGELHPEEGQIIPEDVFSETNGDYYHAPETDGPDVYAMKGVGGRIGRGAKEILRVDSETTETLLSNFINRIHILHPFLNKPSVIEWVHAFSDRYGVDLSEGSREEIPGASESISPENSFGSMASSAMMDRSQYPGVHQYPHPSYNSQLPTPTKAGSKRKRESNVQPGPPPFAQGAPSTFYRQPTPVDLPQQRIAESLTSAIVLLVLALGAITGHKAPVPGPLPSFPNAVNGGVSDHFHNPPASVQAAPGFPQRDSLENIDVIPGLAYCAKALQILSLHEGRSEVEYVQATLLAGLYWGQLGRPMDSWKWISSACMACQNMINWKLPYVPEQDPKRDMMVRTFWSCVQLESDLLAELDVPRSGITRLEASESLRMSLTDKLVDDPEMWLYFMAQYSIRKILNQVHSELYKQSNAPLINSLKTAQYLIQCLEDWRNTLPPPLQWSDADPPSSDINAARLRAKYYGAKYIINRPFVEYFIHKQSNPNMINPASMTSPALSLSSLSQSSPPTSAHTPLGIDNRRGSMVADDTREVPPSYTASCKTCIEAAIKSTSAFHGFDAVSNRPILTNIFGTAHAQFGNLLVLQAAYRHPKLKQFVDRDVLRGLLSKTLGFLRTLTPISPSLAQDVIILEDASSKLDFFHTA